MLVDARSVPENSVIETDVCIVGAGAAGITLAREFIGKRFRVCLLESGGFEFGDKIQDLYNGANAGFSVPLRVARLRYFGGSTNHWGSYCRPLDDIDFEARDWVPDSGWPFKKSELEPYYERAQSICQLGPYVYDPQFWQTTSGAPLPLASKRIVTSIFQMREPALRFGAAYRDEIVKAANVTTFLHANLLSFEADSSARSVKRARVGSLDGPRFSVTGKVFILAAGAIENARLLLLSNDRNPDGLGNENGIVGRFFMSHALCKPGLFLPSDPLIPATLYQYDKPAVGRLRIVGHLTLSPETQRQNRLLNFNASLKFPVPVASTGLLSAKRLVNREFDTLAKDLRNIIADMDGVAAAAYWKVRTGMIPVEAYSLTCAIEQSPNRDSRVSLSSDRDALGQRRVRLDWRLTAVDKNTLRRSLEILGAELGRAALGRLKISLEKGENAWPELVQDGGHHIGTTRMHVDPKQGVVDGHCRVHGISNLFVAGSSVFPTSGHANPTLTIVALALRLAADVRRQMA
jgi:choline dehydrogenase-like flavoprotein